jgi:type I restriction enzyme S subunit
MKMEEKVGWKKVQIGNFIDFVGGGTPDKKTSDYWNGTIKWASVKDVKNKYLYETQDMITELGLKNSASQLAEKGELILVTRISPGKCVIAKDDIAINQDLKIVRLKSDVSTNLLYYFFTATENEFVKKSSGTTVKGIRLEEIRGIEIDLPPLPEQRAIVSRIEQLFSELDNGIANLRLAQEQLKVYRQAVLKKAFEGELTRKWREQQTDLPDARDLLEQIRKEREEAAKVSGKKVKPVKPLTEDEIAELPGLPEGWGWVRLRDVTYKIGDVDHKMPKEYPNGIPYVATKDFTDELKIDFSTSKTISKEDYVLLSAKIKPEKGDIIFPRYGTIGKNILIDFDKEFLVSYSCAIIKNITKLMDVKYVYQYLLSPVIKDEIRKHTRETTQANVGIASIEIFVFPLCSLPEQHAIVQEIETRLSVCDKMTQDIDEALEKAEALRQSILKKAFEGKLLSEKELAEVRSAEDWEPAEVLLERIRAERAGNGKK